MRKECAANREAFYTTINPFDADRFAARHDELELKIYEAQADGYLTSESSTYHIKVTTIKHNLKQQPNHSIHQLNHSNRLAARRSTRMSRRRS